MFGSGPEPEVVPAEGLAIRKRGWVKARSFDTAAPSWEVGAAVVA
jgi:hypothetical protein